MTYHNSKGKRFLSIMRYNLKYIMKYLWRNYYDNKLLNLLVYISLFLFVCLSDLYVF